MSKTVLRLYRCCLRVSYQFPLRHLASKLRYDTITEFNIKFNVLSEFLGCVHKIVLQAQHEGSV